MERTNIDIIDYIPCGYHNRISRSRLAKSTGCDDRLVRLMIANASEPIVSADGGYFIPNLNDPTDLRLAQIYRDQEKHRAKMILQKLKKFKGI